MATTLELWFDLRTPPELSKHTIQDTYAAALDMCEWADSLGFQAITVGEHHTTEDHYLTSPVQMAGVIGGRTKNLQLRMIILTPFYNLLRLAEDLAVLNIATGGRAIPVISSGYVPREFDMYGVRTEDRVPIVEEAVQLLRAAWSGQPFKYRGREINIVSPVSDPPPRLVMGANSPLMIRKAAALADGLSPAEQGMYEKFREERIKRGKGDPGPFPRQTPSFLYVTEEPERMWDVVGPHWLHTSNSYFRWAQQVGKTVNDKFPAVETVEDLKRNPGYRVVTPEQCLQMFDELGEDAQLHMNPMQGGLDPKVAWRSLKLFEDKVLPYLNNVKYTDNLLY